MEEFGTDSFFVGPRRKMFLASSMASKMETVICFENVPFLLHRMLGSSLNFHIVASGLKTSRGLKACYESENVWESLLVSVFLPQTLLCTVEDGMLVLLLQVLPVLVFLAAVARRFVFPFSGGCSLPVLWQARWRRSFVLRMYLSSSTAC